MKIKFTKIMSFIIIMNMLISIPIYANTIDIKSMPGSFPEVANCKYLPADRSMSWTPTEPILIYNYIFVFQVSYITKNEAMAIVEGYRNSDFKNEMVQLLDYAQRTGSYAGGYIAGAQIVKIATKLGLKRVSSFFSGVGGAIAIGFVVDDFLNFIRYLDYNNFRDAIEQTPDNHHVKITHNMTKDGHTYRKYTPYTNDYAFTISPHEKVQSGTWSTNASDMLIYQ